jgi:hypothetical protein
MRNTRQGAQCVGLGVAMHMLCASIACGPSEPLALRLQLTEGAEQACPATSCVQIPLQCDAVASIRIVDPKEPLAPFVSICQDLTDARDICPLNRVELPITDVPNQRLEVQVAVYPKDALPRQNGNPVCPAGLKFSPNGKPTGVGGSPAIAGRGFYSPGDTQTVIDLGCTDLTLINGAACTANTTTSITAAVNDFDSGIFLAPSAADTVAVSVGEPKVKTDPVTMLTEWQLATANLQVMQRTVQSPVPGWSVETPTRFKDAACVSVLEDGAQATSTVTCRVAKSDTATLDIQSVRLSRTTLSEILAAVGLQQFPDLGIVVGIVRDADGNPAPNVSVQSTAGVIQYVNAQRTGVGGTATSASGIFISRNASFPSTFSVRDGTSTGIAGTISGKVSVVVLEAPNQ